MSRCRASCPCRASGGMKGPCLTVPKMKRPVRVRPVSPLASLPPEDPRVWRQASAGTVALARGGKWTAAERAQAKKALAAAGTSWKAAFEWATARGVEGLYLSSMNPRVALEFLAEQGKAATS